MNPNFITFEGIEGCGKSTQAKLLREFLTSRGREVILTREPGGTKSAESIRSIMVESEEVLEPTTELLLSFAARTEHVEKIIKPALKNNQIIISDRFTDSAHVYQGIGRGISSAVIDQIQKITIGNLTPDITFLIDADPKITLKRLEGRRGNNRYDKMNLDFHQKIRSGFLQLAKNHQRVKVINGSKSADEVFAEIKSYLL
jgi:dTMP kinase